MSQRHRVFMNVLASALVLTVWPALADPYSPPPDYSGADLQSVRAQEATLRDEMVAEGCNLKRNRSSGHCAVILNRLKVTHLWVKHYEHEVRIQNEQQRRVAARRYHRDQPDHEASEAADALAAAAAAAALAGALIGVGGEDGGGSEITTHHHPEAY